MKAWRLVNPKHAATALDGEGARITGGRWNHKGTRIVHLAESLALAAMETLVHVQEDQAPSEMAAIEVELPDGLSRKTLSIAELPPDWGSVPGPDSLKEIGTAWIKEGREALLIVPSAVVPMELNFLLNPDHPDAKLVTKKDPIPFHFDRRLRP